MVKVAGPRRSRSCRRLPDLDQVDVGQILAVRLELDGVGTRLVSDLRPGPEGSAPGPLVVAGSRAFFAADDGVHGRELWTLSLPIGAAPP